MERAGRLDSRIRTWIQNPAKILGPYVKEGMVVLDVGCGPGFFSIYMAEMVGEEGKVIAADLQEGMLECLRKKIKGTGVEERIAVHKCGEDKIGVSESVDFVLLFYVVHEIKDKEEFFNEIVTILKPEGKVLIVEPPFHVSKREFEETVGKARDAGLTEVERPKMLLSKAAVLELRS
jgi:ubiquinone/menaquinone biosynthesis C-methylase UbiE